MKHQKTQQGLIGIMILSASLLFIGGKCTFWLWNIEEPVSQNQQRGLSNDDKAKIDDWIAQNGYNENGDPLGTVYAGGSPLFNEQTGESTDRYEYILKRHPELKNQLQLK